MENKRLLIKKPYVQYEKNEVIVHNVLACGTEEYDLQSRMSEDTYQYADVESVADYVVAGCLRLAIINELDIQSEFPVSEEFGWKVSNFLDSIYSDTSITKRKIRVDVPTTPYKTNVKTHVATGLSCGVDSLYSINKHANRCEWGGGKCSSQLRRNTQRIWTNK